MQTFAPDGRNIRSGFYKLDWRRLGKQRVETYQIMRCIMGMSDGWVNHPAVRMWRPYLGALSVYGMTNCEVWVDQGYNDSLMPKFEAVYLATRACKQPYSMPRFLDDIAESHRSNLVRKDPDHYREFWPDIPDDIPYVWPA